MVRWWSLVLWTLGALPSMAQTPFQIASSAMVGKPEVGFDSRLVSAGRVDPAYNGEVSLPFQWSGLPRGTKAIAVVYDDPDARRIMKDQGMDGAAWLHWIVADIDPRRGGLPANASASERLIQGLNSSDEPVYEGPAPPADLPTGVPRPIVHVYRLRVYALSAKTNLSSGFTLADLEKAMVGKVLATAQLNLSWSN